MPDTARPDHPNHESLSASRLARPARSVEIDESSAPSSDVRQRALRALQGSLADIPFSSDDFAEMKRREIDLEEQGSACRS
jgi:hypothetical protein